MDIDHIGKTSQPMEIENKEYWSRHCSPKDMYDDGGYCENKIHKCGTYYLHHVGYNTEVFCESCFAASMFNDIKGEDFWLKEHKEICERDTLVKLR